jgi:hypothetical protein
VTAAIAVGIGGLIPTEKLLIVGIDLLHLKKKKTENRN